MSIISSNDFSVLAAILLDIFLQFTMVLFFFVVFFLFLLFFTSVLYFDTFYCYVFRFPDFFHLQSTICY